MATLATGVRWGTETPAIYFDISYTATRSGANMVYTVNVDFQALSSAYGRYFGYPIYLDLSLDGVSKVSGATVKNPSPSNWSAGDVYYHSNSFSVAKTTGATTLGLRIYSGQGSSRSQSYSYSLPVSPAGSELSLPSAGFTIGSAGTISITRYDTSFTDDITYTVGSASGTIRNITSGTSISSFSWTPPTSLYNQMIGQTQRTGTITIVTKSGGTTVGTRSYTFTLKATTAYNLPVVTLTYQRGTGTGSSFVQSDDGPNVKVTATISVYGGQTATYVLKLDGTNQSSVSGVTSGTRESIIQNVSTQSTHTLSATLTDTLGNASGYSLTIATQAVPMNINVDYPGIAFGKLSERNAFECAMDEYLYGSLSFDNGNMTQERRITFCNPGASQYHHNIYIYGGAPTAQAGIGVYDQVNGHAVAYFVTGTDTLIIGAALADVQIKGRSVDWYQKKYPDLGSGVDLNSCLNSGYYVQKWSNNATTALHYPTTAAGYLEVFSSEDKTYILQRYTLYNTSAVYMRNYYNGSWSAWSHLQVIT